MAEINNLPEIQNYIEKLQSLKQYFQTFENCSIKREEATFNTNLRLLNTCLQTVDRRYISNSVRAKEIIDDICSSLMYIMKSCSAQNYTQILCSNVFCCAVTITSKSNYYTVKIFKSYLTTFSLKLLDREWFIVCFCNGMLQSKEFVSLVRNMQEKHNNYSLLYLIFDILEKVCMKYSRMTILAFKTLVCLLNKFASLPGINLKNIMDRIFAIVDSNWENPINGVRDQNFRIFEILLDLLHKCDNFKSVEDLLHHVVEEESWKMKKKYFMLQSLLPRYGVVKAFTNYPDLLPGVLSSLSSNHLVSAGSNVYKACLIHIEMDDWISIFMPSVILVLTNNDHQISTEKQNIFKYWMPPTLKMFPAARPIVLDNVIMDSADILNSMASLFSAVSLLRLGRRDGWANVDWNNDYPIGCLITSISKANFLKIITCALQHSNELIRAEAFAFICTSSVICSIPEYQEFKFIRHFLIENINVDNAVLRQTILNSVAVFLARINESSTYNLNSVKNRQNNDLEEDNFLFDCNNEFEFESLNGISKNVHFLEWLYRFIVSNLEQGTNYQRKILSLRIYKEVMSCFASLSCRERFGIKKKMHSKESKKILDYATECEKWHFNSPHIRKLLLSSILDPSNDIREIAGSILINNFSYEEQYDSESLSYAMHLCTRPMFYEIESGILFMKVLGNWANKTSCNKKGFFNNKSVNGDEKTVKMEHTVKKIERRHSCNMLKNQEMLLEGLQNNKTDHQHFISKNMKVKLKNREQTYEGLTVTEASKLNLTDDSKIFEGLAVVFKDGTVGEHTFNKTTSIIKMKTNNKIPNPNPIQVLENCKTVSSFENCCMGKTTFETVYEEACITDDSYKNIVTIENKIKELSLKNMSKTIDTYDKRDSDINRCFLGETTDIDSNNKCKFIHTLHTVGDKSNSLSGHSTNKPKYMLTSANSDRDIDTKQKKDCGSYIYQHNTPCKIEYLDYKELPYLFDQEGEYNMYQCNATHQELFNTSCKVGDSNNKDKNNECPEVVTPKLKQKKKRKRKKGYVSIKNIPSRVARFKNSQTNSRSFIMLSTCYNSSSRCSISSNSRFAPPWSKDYSEIPLTIENKKSDYNIAWPLEPNTQDRRQDEDGMLDFLKREDQTVLLKNTVQTRETSNDINSKYFSNISDCNKVYKSMSCYLLKQAERQLMTLKHDILKAVTSGSPVHGILSALNELCIESDAPESHCLTAEEEKKIIALLEEIVSYLLEELASKTVSRTGLAPSFAEMDMAIKNSIYNSAVQIKDEFREATNLSPAQQLILNCIWLNLKACCNIASSLARRKCSTISIIKRCGNVIKQVLIHCRHKGAIEAAGISLSGFVKHITSEKRESRKKISLMLERTLREILDLLLNGDKKSSVTRSSAGLSVLIHRLVASDMRSEKPLLHACMTQLLDIAKTSAPECKQVLIDLPQAQAMHFLKILVQDSSLRQEMALYMNSVTLICFGNFSSSLWTIRNAALQLSGALIPKLIGQNKIQDEGIDVGNTISIEEFFSHYPELTDFMLKNLQEAATNHSTQALQEHAGLVPVLSLLSKLSIGSKLVKSSPSIQKIEEYLDCFLYLLSSCIYQIRKLAAKAYARFLQLSCTYETIVSTINNLQRHNTICGEVHSICLRFQKNHLNGILLLLKYLVEKLKYENENSIKYQSSLLKISVLLRKNFNYILEWESCTYFNKILILELSENEDVRENFSEDSAMNTCTVKKFQIIYKQLNKGIFESSDYQNKVEPGLLLWAAKEIELIIKKCSRHQLITIWYNGFKLCKFFPNITESIFAALKWRLDHDKTIELILDPLFIALMKIYFDEAEEDVCYMLFPLCNIMLFIMQNMKINVLITFKDVQKFSELCLKGGRSDYNAIAIAFLAEVFSYAMTSGEESNVGFTKYPVGNNYISYSIDIITPILNFLLNFTKHMEERSNSIMWEENFRFNIIKAINILGPFLWQVIPQIQKTEIIKCRELGTLSKICRIIICTHLDMVISLLQDENCEIRKEAANFVSYFPSLENVSIHQTINPYLSLKKLLQPEAILELLPRKAAIKYLWKKITYMENDFENVEKKIINFTSSNKISVTNPFDHDLKNIYCEEIKLVDMFGSCLREICGGSVNGYGMCKLLTNINGLELPEAMYKTDISTIKFLLNKMKTCHLTSHSVDTTILFIIAKKIKYQIQVRGALSENKLYMFETMSLLNEIFEILEGHEVWAKEV